MSAPEHVHTSTTAESFLTPHMRALVHATVLDPVVSAANTLSSLVTGNESVRDLLRGKSLGHALHPLLIEVPMGTWTSALVLDTVGGQDGRSAARLLTGVGVEVLGQPVPTTHNPGGVAERDFTSNGQLVLEVGGDVLLVHGEDDDPVVGQQVLLDCLAEPEPVKLRPVGCFVVHRRHNGSAVQGLRFGILTEDSWRRRHVQPAGTS